MIDSKRTNILPTVVKRSNSSPESESMSALTSSISIDVIKSTPTRMTPKGIGTLFDRISKFSNEKGEKKNGRRSTSSEKSSYSLSTIHQPDDSLARSPLRNRLETTVLDIGNVVHSPKRNEVSSTSVSFLDCAITPIKRRERADKDKKDFARSINTSKTISLTSSEGEVSINAPDEWREVVDPESGRSYFYNRRTRVSKWKLPKGAILRQKKNSSFVSAVTDVTAESVKVQGSMEREVTESDERSLSNHVSTNNADNRGTTTITAAIQSVSPNDASAHVNSGAVTTSQFKSPQDTTISTPSLFCLYCGVKTTSLQELESHLNQCSSFIKIQQEPDLLSTQMQLEGLLFSVWSKIRSNGKPTTAGVSGSYDLFQSPFKYDSRVVDEGGDYTFSPPKYNVREHSSKVNDDDCIEKKTCPFCEDTLVGGDQFSSHLLVCKERKRRRNMRREESSPRFRTPRTPGRRMPWER